MPMRKGKIHLITFLFCLTMPLAMPREADAKRPSSAKKRNLSRLLERERKKQTLPAVAAVVIHKSRIVAEGVAGYRKKGSKSKATLKDRWHLGSCTKAMTATMVARLIEQGRLSWDTTIAQALPHLADDMRPEYRNITIEMLLSNRGRIGHEWDVPGLWPVLWKREGMPFEERRKMAKAMLDQPPKVAKGEYFYSNCGFSIAGHMAETITGKPWEDLVRENVFVPLKMRSAGFGIPWKAEPIKEPWPHNKDGTPVRPDPMADNPPSIGPGGTVHASIRDWSKFVIEHMKGARGKKSGFLKPSSYKRLHRGRKIKGSPNEYALGWMIIEREWAKGKKSDDRGRCLQHAGSNNSWYALVWIAPERDFAVLCATNIGGEGIFSKIDAVCWAVIQNHLEQRRR
ncbi:MAG: beta-lactamase family protein [Phycisphaerales bacterium]|nr:beta-lactamase family protein [Phycisphaerales bacterium]